MAQLLNGISMWDQLENKLKSIKVYLSITE